MVMGITNIEVTATAATDEIKKNRSTGNSGAFAFYKLIADNLEIGIQLDCFN